MTKVASPDTYGWSQESNTSEVVAPISNDTTNEIALSQSQSHPRNFYFNRITKNTADANRKNNPI